MQSKLADFNSKLKQSSLDAFIVTNPTNIFYLTGFRGVSQQEREAILIFSKTSTGFDTTLVVPRLYQNEAKKVASENLKIKIVPERHELLPHAAKLLKGCKRVGFEENDLRFAQYHFLQRSLNKTLMPFADLIENLRIIKTDEEIKRIEKAQIISQKAFEQLAKTLKIGQTEEEIAQNLAKIIKSLGARELAFESIVASGPNAGLPHYVTGKRKIKKGEVLLLDFGAKYQNYLGDLTRTVFIGKAADRLKNIYEHVKTAQRAALGKIRSGASPSEVFHEASHYFKKHNLHKYFLHGLGHGIGLEVHEAPYLRPNLPPTSLQTTNYQLLTSNMITSVEPGLYFSWGGIRIEDLVIVGKSNAKVLGRASPELAEIG